MNRLTRFCFASVACTLPALTASAEVSIPHQFAKGNKAIAAEVNSNFMAVVEGINTNSAAITQLNSDVITLDSKITAGIPGPQGPAGIGAGNSSSLVALGSLLGQETLASTFPAYALDRQRCDSDKIAASATVGGLSLTVTGLLGEESLSQTYQFSFVGTSSSSVSIAPLIGSPANLTIFTVDGKRTINGIVSRAGKSFASDGTAMYSVTIEPSLSLLQQANGYQIYQGVSVPDVIQTILLNAGVSPNMQLAGSYPAKEMLVMYNQNPFSYIQRLTEENAIAYYFDGDSPVFFDSAAGYASSGLALSYTGINATISQNTPTAISYFQGSAQRAGLHTADGFDFTLPNTSLLSTQGAGSIEQYRFNYQYTSGDDPLAAAQNSLSRANAASLVHYGTSNSAPMTAGATFDLNASDRASVLSGTYVATAVKHALIKSADGSCMIYANTFRSMPGATFAAPELRTPAQKVSGVISATVVGPAGEQWFTDQYGRIKIQFHWDRVGNSDENSSAWVRVATPVNRLDDTHLYIPPIGSEVLVSFLDGDPSLPVVTGSLYNGNNQPPLQLPENKEAAANDVYNDYYYYSYTGGGDDGTLTQTVFTTVKTVLSLSRISGCKFISDETYSLSQNSQASNVTVNQHVADNTIGRFTPVCNTFNPGNNTLDLIVDGQPLQFKMDPDWNTGIAIVNPPDTVSPKKRLGFVYLVKKSP